MTLFEQAQEALWIVANDPNSIGYDVETSGLDWKRNSIVGYVITGKHTLVATTGAHSPRPYRQSMPLQSIYVPIRHAGGGNLADPGVPPLKTAEDTPVEHWFERELAKAFETRRAKGYLTVGHNIQFDALFSWKHGIMLGRNMADTQNQATMLNEHQEGFSLDKTALVFGVTPKLGQVMYNRLSQLFGGVAKKTQMSNFWRTAGNDPVVVDYSAGDGITTLEVYWAQLPFLTEERLDFIMHIENQLIWTLVRMEHRGWKIANDKFEYVLTKMQAMLDEARAELPYGFAVRSPAAVRALSERAGHTNWPMTDPTLRFPGGQPSLNEAFLDTFPEGAAVLRIRKLEKIMGDVIKIRDTHVWNGRVHGHLNQLKADEYGTISGRMSASSPNLQQIPARDEELASLIRLLFEADAGMTLYEADYSQQEPRLWAHYSHDPYLNEGYNASPPRDVHTLVADLVNTTRKYAKSINLGLFYLMGKKTFFKHMQKFNPGITRQESDTIHDKWYSYFTKVKQFQKDATSVFKSRGWVRTILGRRARYSGDGKHYVASNRIIQGGSADITKWALLTIDMRLEAEGDISHLLMTVHDSIIWQSPDGDTETPKWIEAIMVDLNGSPFKLTVRFTVDTTSGKNWAEVKFGKEDE